MAARSTLRGVVLRTGVLAAGYAGIRWLFNLLPSADQNFFEQSAPPTGDPELDALLPAKYYRTDAFAGVFSADDAAIRAVLPTPELHPAHLPGGQAVVMISAFNYLETSIGPYGEVMIAVPCVLGHDAPPLLPLLMEARYPGFGYFVLHLPVTSRIALEGGRRLANYPKFIGDMAFERQPDYQRVRLTEGDSPILTLTIHQRGLPLKDNRPVHVYTARDPDLLKTAIPACSVYQVGLMPGWGHLALGTHPIAEQLRGLDVDRKSVV